MHIPWWTQGAHSALLMEDPICLSRVRQLGNSVLATAGRSAPQGSLPLSGFPRVVISCCKKGSRENSCFSDPLAHKRLDMNHPSNLWYSNSLTGSFIYCLSVIKKLFFFYWEFCVLCWSCCFCKRRQILTGYQGKHEVNSAVGELRFFVSTGIFSPKWSTPSMGEFTGSFQSPSQLGQLKASDILCWTVALGNLLHSLQPIRHILFSSYLISLNKNSHVKPPYGRTLKLLKTDGFKDFLQTYFFLKNEKHLTLILQTYYKNKAKLLKYSMAMILTHKTSSMK